MSTLKICFEGELRNIYIFSGEPSYLELCRHKHCYHIHREAGKDGFKHLKTDFEVYTVEKNNNKKKTM